jgi:hypothetical protein
LRELGALAYERELAQELATLEEGFRRWRAGQSDAFDLSNAIHKFHQGPGRDLFSRYANSTLDLAVARAIHRGVVSLDEAGEDLLSALGSHLAFLKERDPEAAQPGVAAAERVGRSAPSRVRR